MCVCLYICTLMHTFSRAISIVLEFFFNLYIYAICTFPDLMKTGVLLKIKWPEKEEAGQLKNNQAQKKFEYYLPGGLSCVI